MPESAANQYRSQEEMMPMDDDMIGAIKIKDGLFIGDEFAAQVKLLVLVLTLLSTGALHQKSTLT